MTSRLPPRVPEQPWVPEPPRIPEPVRLGRPSAGGLLVAWGNAWLAGRAALGDVVVRVTGDEHHEVVGQRADPLPLDSALLQLRADGATKLTLALPAPGDARGLPGPGSFTTAAVIAGQGVLVGGLRPCGLVPTAQWRGPPNDAVAAVTWASYPIGDRGVPASCGGRGPDLRAADTELRDALLEATETLMSLDAAGARPATVGALAALRRGAPTEEAALPAGYPADARALLARASVLADVLDLAQGEPGTAVDAATMSARAAALRRLAAAVRRARAAAYNAFPGGPDASRPSGDARPTR